MIGKETTEIEIMKKRLRNCYKAIESGRMSDDIYNTLMLSHALLGKLSETINCQQEEIDRLKKGRREDCEALLSMNHEFLSVKAKVIKEYKERVKQELLNKGFYPVFVKNALDEVEKEMESD